MTNVFKKKAREIYARYIDEDFYAKDGLEEAIAEAIKEAEQRGQREQKQTDSAFDLLDSSSQELAKGTKATPQDVNHA